MTSLRDVAANTPYASRPIRPGFRTSSPGSRIVIGSVCALQRVSVGWQTIASQHLVVEEHATTARFGFHRPLGRGGEMSYPFVYRFACATVAVGAVTRLSSEAVASVLWPMRLFWWPSQSTPTSPGTFGTPELAIGSALLRLDFGLDLYGRDMTLIANTQAYGAMLRRLAETRVRTVRRIRSMPDPAAAGVEPRRRSCHPLRGWLARHHAGYWLYVVVSPDGDAHVLATCGEHVMTGEAETCHDWDVASAFRVHPPPGGPT